MKPGFFSGFLLKMLACISLFFNVSQAFAQSEVPVKQTQEDFVSEVRKNFDAENFAALDQTADQARDSKERFPGADWKLFVFYQALTWPGSGASATDQQWKAHLDQLQKWTRESPKSQTARIALAASWVEYAKLTRISDRDWRGFENDIGGKEYQKRLKHADNALDFDSKNFFVNLINDAKNEIKRNPNTKLPSLCPHWYYVRLALEQGRPFEDWRRYNDIFARAIALEPNYYYFYQTKAFDLLPQNHGVKGQWESFAENSANSVGGKEGDIIYYMIVSYVMPRYISRDGHGDFFRDNLTVWGQKIWDGYKHIEESYGTSKYRQNEMAMIAVKAQQYAVAKILFDRIGEDWDERVWQKKAAYDGYRNMVRAKTPSTATKLKSDLSGLKATLSSRLAAYQKSQDVVIEAVIENPASADDPDSAYEIGLAAFALVIQDSNKRGQENVLLPQSDGSQSNKLIKAGGLIRLTYHIGFLLPAGNYEARMKSLNSNTLQIRIGGSAKR